MTAERLEGLAELCDAAIADTSSGFGAYFDAQDIADLARCARDWAERQDIAGLRRALAIAKGCEDYGGGYQDKELEIYHHGMDTVQRCIQAAIDGDDSLQLRVVEAIGTPPRTEGGGE